MSDQILSSIIGAIVSGLFSLVIAFIPQLLQRNKTTYQKIVEVIDKKFYDKWLLYFFLWVFIILFFQFIWAIIVSYGFFCGLIIAASQTGDAKLFFENFVKTNFMDGYRLVESIDMFVTPILNSVPVIFILKYCSSFFAKHSIIKTIFVPILSTVIGFTTLFIFYDRNITSQSYLLFSFLITIISSIIASLIGLMFSRKNHTRFLIIYIASRLNKSEQESLLELTSTFSYPLFNKKQAKQVPFL